MSGPLIAIIGVVYLWVAVDLLLLQRDLGMSIAFLGYSIGNLGLWIKAARPVWASAIFGG
jgi:hypothetical protein